MKTLEDIKQNGIELNTIYWGDCLEVLKQLPDECVDTIITSPPYWGLRDYKVEGQIGLEPTLEEYLDKLFKITSELKRVLKKSGSLWVNMGDCYSNLPKHQKCMLMQPERFALKMIDEQGWILRQKIIWAKQILINKENRTIGSVMPTSVKDRFNMSWEYLYHFVKNKKYYFNLDAVRIPAQVVGVTDLRPAGILRQRMYPESKYNKFNYRVRDAERKAGQPQYKATQEEIEKYKKQYQGKFSGMGEEAENYGSPRARNTRIPKEGQEYKTRNPERTVSLLGKNIPSVHLIEEDTTEQLAKQLHIWYLEATKQLNPENYNLNAQKKYNELTEQQKQIDRYIAKKLLEQKNEIPDLWQINPEPHSWRRELGVEAEHFATFPRELVRIPILSSCPPKGVVLDPFMGSGTVGVVAKKLGRNYIGIDKGEIYCQLAEKRLASTPPQPLL